MKWIACAVLLVAAVAAVRGQSEARRVTWEFATVEHLQEVWIGSVKHSTANICYHASDGCRWDTIRVTVGRWGQINDALAAATARLGEDGWEPVGLTQLSPENRPSVLMKRVRE